MARPNSPAIRKPARGRRRWPDTWTGQPFIMLTSSTAIEPRLRRRRRGSQGRWRLPPPPPSAPAGEDLADEIAHMGGEGDELMFTASRMSSTDIRMTMMFLPVEEDAEHPEREQDRRHREVVGQADGRHGSDPLARLHLDDGDGRLRGAGRLGAGSCRFTPALWLSVRTMAPIMATSRTRPESWKK